MNVEKNNRVALSSKQCRAATSNSVVSVSFAVLFTLVACVQNLLLKGQQKPQQAAHAPAAFSLVGLTSPALVSDSVFVSARNVPSGATVMYTLDGTTVAESSTPPYWLGQTVSGVPSGFDVRGLLPGTHVLGAMLQLPYKTAAAGPQITLSVVPSIGASFSAGLRPYRNHFASLQVDMASLLRRTSTPGAKLSTAERRTRAAVLAMYQNWGIDPSLDWEHDQSAELVGLEPKGAASARTDRGALPVSLWFSPDTSCYHSIPVEWPRVALPAGYLRTIQFSTAYHGDGIGFGETIARESDPVLPVVSQWYGVTSTHVSVPFRVRADWNTYLPTLPTSDLHLILIDPKKNMFVSGYKVRRDPHTGGPAALYAGKPTTFDGLGAHGGSIAAGFAELPVLVQPGEATDPAREIPHAIGGSISRVWAARVFPANSWDSGVRTSRNTCTHSGYTNTGLVPYGGVIQLDPKLDLQALPLSLPARRILRAMQVYGYYVMDFGCSDLDVFTALNADELERFGGVWGNRSGPGVQNEIKQVLLGSKLYVVPPPMKKQ